MILTIFSPQVVSAPSGGVPPAWLRIAVSAETDLGFPEFIPFIFRLSRGSAPFDDSATLRLLNLQTLGDQPLHQLIEYGFPWRDFCSTRLFRTLDEKLVSVEQFRHKYHIVIDDRCDGVYFFDDRVNVHDG